MKFNIKIDSDFGKGDVMYCANDNFENRLHIEGSDNRILIYQAFGNGQAVDVHYGRTLEFDLPNGAIPERVIEFIEAFEDDFQEEFDRYSEDWDGSNMIGSFQLDEYLEKHPIQEKIDECSGYDFRICIDYIYDTPDDYVYNGWGYLSDFRSEFPKPVDDDFKSLAQEIIDSNDDSECYLHFNVADLAEFLDEEQEEIWPDLS